MSTRYFALWAGSALLATGVLAGCDNGGPADTPPSSGEPASNDTAMYNPEDTGSSDSGSTNDRTNDREYTANDQSMNDNAPDQSTYGPSPSGQAGQGLESMSVDNIVGESVLSSEGEEIGEVKDVVTDGMTGASGKQFVVVDVGGFLGVSEKSVVIPFDELRATDDGRIQSDILTRQTIEAMPEYDPSAYKAVKPESDSPDSNSTL